MDGRVRYTKMVIRQSFLSLLKGQAVDKVTVSDICRLAEINRATFYRHYENQYSILHELELDLLDQSPPPQPGQSPGEIFQTAFQALWEKREDWRLLLSGGTDPGLWARLYRFLEERLPQGGDEERRRFLLHGLSGLTLDWMGAGFQCSPQQMAASAVQYFTT